MELGWLGRAAIATICFVPIMASSGFFSRHYGIRSEAIIIWYSIGIVIAGPCLLKYFKILTWQELAPSNPLLIILLIGMTCGVASNILFFQALSSAPNPGLPMAVTNSSTIIVFLITVLLAQFLPQYFATAKPDLWHLIGIVLTIAGISIITLKQ